MLGHGEGGPAVAARGPAPPALLFIQTFVGDAVQVLAARKLFTYCRAGEAVRRAVVAGGGVHMLLIMLDSLDNTVRDLCTRTLTDLAADDGVRCGQGRQRWRGSQDTGRVGRVQA